MALSPSFNAMRFLYLLAILLLLNGCKENHQHDGVYIAERPVLGVMRTFIVEGNMITYYLMGEVKAVKCKQYEDRIETSDDIVYTIDASGNLIIPGKEGKSGDEKLIKRTTKTKVTPSDLEQMIDEAMPQPGVLESQHGAH